MKKLLLTDLQSFGCIDYYTSLVGYDELLLEQCEHYKKGSYSNRYYLATANGSRLLSIPLVHSDRSRTAFKDLRISDTDPWQKIHWRTIVSAYKRSPWFDFYQPELEVMYNKNYQFNLDWNWDAFRLVSKWLHLDWSFDWTRVYKKEYEDENIVDERSRFLPGKKSQNKIYYPQVFEDKNGFFPNLSILDLLFCEGNNARRLLKNANLLDETT